MIKRCVKKNGPIRINKRKTILELGKNRFVPLKLRRINKNKSYKNFFSLTGTLRGIRGTLNQLYNKARGILNSSGKIKVHGNLIKRCVKNGPIRIYKHKTIRELEKSIPRIFKLLRINKNKP